MKKLLAVVGVLGILLACAAWWLYDNISAPNTQQGGKDNILLIPQDASWEGIQDSLSLYNIVLDRSSLELTARLMSLTDGDLKGGRYHIPPAISNRQLVNLLRSGRQVPVSLVINNVRTIHDLAGDISTYVSADSTELISAMLDSAWLRSIGLQDESALTMYIPNTYQVYWNTPADKLVKRLHDEWAKWWQQGGRIDKAKARGLSKAEVYTLASIVDKESNLVKEKPTIAGVYLNRLQRGMALQADPTVVFATGQYDLRRVLNKHLAIDSPYNTYKYAGLPPGPIYMASISGLDAVLNAEDHNYLYFCAGPGYGSVHLFANTLKQHNSNARTFHRWLNQQGIR